MKSRWLSISVAIVVLLAILTPSAGAQDVASRDGQVLRGYLPLSPAYRQAKAALDAQAAAAGPGPAEADLPLSPVVSPKWTGQSATNFSPSDATGAIGPDRYIELVNTSIGVYNRSGVLLSSKPQTTWTGSSTACGDGVIVWDNNQNRFFYAMLSISTCGLGTPGTYELIWGFSKASAPTALPTDWCSYVSTFGAYGSDFPDYPKIGMSNDFVLIGVNRFDHSLTTYKGSDVAWTSKPASGTIAVCPAASTFKQGVQATLLNTDGTEASTPVPANNADPSTTGYVVANHDVSGGGSSNSLSVYTVTKDSVTGNAVFSAPTNVIVPSYRMPPSAPQKGTTDVLDTLDGRLMNAVAASDPGHGGAKAIWTQHTVAASTGGRGAEIRWYEINPATGALFQRGVVHNLSRYVFTGAISPDRNGAAGAFGSNMVVGFSFSSPTMYPAVGMVSKVGAGAQSAIVGVAPSPKADTDFTCTSPYGPPCRWGDYAGASPDPASSTTGSKGMVWLSVMRESASPANPNWTTENFGATP
jgi:hypothetical protein